MKYISSKQAAEKWNLSPRRVVMLATQGKLSGAVLMDNRWLIPEDAERPADLRKKATKSAPSNEPRYVVPFILSCVNSDEQISRFTQEEADIYRLNILYERGEFESARDLCLEILNKSDNPYMRFAALYNLPIICVYLMDFDAAERYTVMFKTAYYVLPAHKDELKIYLFEFDAEMSSIQNFAETYDFSDDFPCSDTAFPGIVTLNALIDVTKIGLTGRVPNITSHEIICRMMEKDGYYYSSMLIHLYLSIMYSAAKNAEKERYHLKKSIEIAVDHNTVCTIASAMLFDTDTIVSVLSEFPSDVRERFQRLADLYIKSQNGYMKYRGSATALANLEQNDYLLISCCLKGQSIEALAERFGLSKSGMNKRLANLYDKLGVNSKKELIGFYLHSVMNRKENI